MPETEFTGGDRFEIRRRLGEGSFGVVYEAIDRERGSRVAVKTLKGADAIALYNLKREFRSLADISHPNLVNLYELLSVDDQWLITMELVQGEGFVRYVRGEDPGRPSDSSDETIALTSESEPSTALELPQEAATLRRKDSAVNLPRLRSALRSLAEGLVALHSAGIVHRDIKPSNVLVSTEGHVTILDFGLVRDQTHQAGTSMRVAGTPAYMSPEQALGNAVSEASDWFAVGIVLWESLVGRRPKRRPSPEHIPPPSEVVEGVPADLDILCRALLQQNAHQRPSGADVLHRLGSSGESSVSVSVSRASTQTGMTFVGRKAELLALQKSFEATEKQEASFAFVHGSSGLGKTALVHHFLDQVQADHHDAVVLRGRCYERESVPYKSVDSLIDALALFLSGQPRSEVEGLLPRDVLALARLFPVLRRVEAIADAKRRFVDISDSREFRQRAFAALRELLTRLADRQPTILFIDDLQWGDTDSTALLHAVLSPPDSPAALLIGTYRTEEIHTSPSLQVFLETWSAASLSNIVEIQLGEFTREESRALAAALLADADPGAVGHSDELVEEAGGNPFFLEKLLTSELSDAAGRARNGGKPHPATLDDILIATVAQVSEPARKLMEVLAVVGRPSNVEVVTRAAGLTDAISLLPQLEAGRLVRLRTTREGEEIEIYHDRIREALLTTVSAERLPEHHRRLLAAFETSEKADAETLAIHAEGCGEIEAAARYAIIAADDAAGALAFDRAAELYEKAIRFRSQEDEETRSLRVRRAQALVNVGRSGEAAEVFLSAVAGASPEEALEIHRLAAQHYLLSGHYAEGLTATRLVLKSHGMALPRTPRRALLSILRRTLQIRLRGYGFKPKGVEELDEALLSRIDICFTVAQGLLLSNTVFALDFQLRGLILALRAGDPYRVARALSLEIILVATAGSRSQKRTRQLEQLASATAKRANEPLVIAMAMLYSGCAGALNGEWRNAVRLSRQAEELFREQCTGVSWELDNAHLFEMFALTWLGDFGQVSEQLPDRLQDAKQRGDIFMETYLETDISPRMHLVLDQPDQARDVAATGLGRWTYPGYHRQHQYALRSRVEILLYEGRGLDAWNAMEHEYQALRGSLLLRTQMNRIIVGDYRGRSALAAALGSSEPTDQKRLFDIAASEVSHLRKESIGWGDALAAFLAASLATARGQRDQALQELATAEALFEASDMHLHAAATRMRRGSLRGDEGGRKLSQEGAAWMSRQGIVQPSKWLRMLSPETND